MTTKHIHSFTNWTSLPDWNGKVIIQRVCSCSARISLDLMPKDEATEWLWDMAQKLLVS